VLDTICKLGLPLVSTPVKLGLKPIQTLKTAKAIRRAHQAYRRNHEEPVMYKIMQANIQLAA
jgi:hypothetical protein